MSEYIFYKKVISKFHYLTAKEIALSLGIEKDNGEPDYYFINYFFQNHEIELEEEFFYHGKYMVKVFPIQDNKDYQDIFFNLIDIINKQIYLNQNEDYSIIHVKMKNKIKKIKVNINTFLKINEILKT